MSIVLSVINLAVLVTLFYTAVPAEARPVLQITALVLTLLLTLLQLRQRLAGAARPAPQATVATSSPPGPQLPVAARTVDNGQLQDAAVVQFLGRLQEKGRLVDFVMDDMAAYADEQVGAAARIVHQGCREVLFDFFRIVPVHDGNEDDPIELADGYDSQSYRLIGRVPERGPYQGQVIHRGWQTQSCHLPQLNEATNDLVSLQRIIAPAEIEIDPQD